MAMVTPAYRPAIGQAPLVGVVTNTVNGHLIPYAQVAADGIAPMLTDERGRFRLPHTPAAVREIRVRAIGYEPKTVQIRASAGAADTLRISLSPIALRLADVRVTDAVCPTETAGVDIAIVTVLDQVRLNAERARLIAHDFPYESDVERTFADQLGATRPLRVDTVQIASEHAWRYEPGGFVLAQGDSLSYRQVPGAQQPVDSTGAIVGESLVIPQLEDFADTAFVAAHCFRYRGLERVESTSMIRVDVEPIKSIRTPDVRGSLYLDPATYQIRRSVLSFEYHSATRPNAYLDAEVETWFREYRPAVVVIDRVTAKMIARDSFSHQRVANRAAIESQRFLAVHFLFPDRTIPVVANYFTFAARF